METRPGLETQDYGDSQSKINQGTELFSIFFFSPKWFSLYSAYLAQSFATTTFLPHGLCSQAKNQD